MRTAALAAMDERVSLPVPELPSAHELVVQARQDIVANISSDRLAALVTSYVLHPAPSYAFWLFGEPRLAEIQLALPGA
ncbi:hypothetical protein [Actinocrispum sp. NPDC049592]|uniref:hypothetical protein n=1 Tax=Actinocrispum sp. NPDC049592 TaxID=3154835 RepID=UPI00343DE428